MRRHKAETSDVLADFVMLDTYDVLLKKNFVMLDTYDVLLKKNFVILDTYDVLLKKGFVMLDSLDTLLEPEGAQTCGSTNNRHYLYARAFLYYNTKSHV